MTNAKYSLLLPNGFVTSFVVANASVSPHVCSVLADRRGGHGRLRGMKAGVFCSCLVPDSAAASDRESPVTFQNLLLLPSERRQPPFPISSETETESGVFGTWLSLWGNAFAVHALLLNSITQLSALGRSFSAIIYVPLTLTEMQELCQVFGVSGSSGFTLGTNSRD